MCMYEGGSIEQAEHMAIEVEKGTGCVYDMMKGSTQILIVADGDCLVGGGLV